MSLARAKRAAVAAAAVLALTAFGLGDAHAQAFNVTNFSCSSTPFGVDLSASGLGHTDLCVIGTASINLDCACANVNGGNCTSASAKNTTTASASTSQEVQPKNGSVSATVTIPFSTSNSQCAAVLACPSGQTAKLVEFAASEDFTLCKVVSASTVCSGPTPSCAKSDVLDTITCTSSGTPFPGKHNSCSALF